MYDIIVYQYVVYLNKCVFTRSFNWMSTMGVESVTYNILIPFKFEVIASVSNYGTLQGHHRSTSLRWNDCMHLIGEMASMSVPWTNITRSSWNGPELLMRPYTSCQEKFQWRPTSLVETRRSVIFVKALNRDIADWRQVSGGNETRQYSWISAMVVLDPMTCSNIIPDFIIDKGS